MSIVCYHGIICLIFVFKPNGADAMLLQQNQRLQTKQESSESRGGILKCVCSITVRLPGGRETSLAFKPNLNSGKVEKNTDQRVFDLYYCDLGCAISPSRASTS